MTEEHKIKQTIVQLFRQIDEREWGAIEQKLSAKLPIDYSSWTGNPSLQFTKEELIAEWILINGAFTRTHHMLGNFDISLNGTSANAFFYLSAKHYLVDVDGDVWSIYGTYDMHLSLEGSVWIIDSIRFNYMFEEGNTLLIEKTDRFTPKRHFISCCVLYTHATHHRYPRISGHDSIVEYPTQPSVEEA